MVPLKNREHPLKKSGSARETMSSLCAWIKRNKYLTSLCYGEEDAASCQLLHVF